MSRDTLYLGGNVKIEDNENSSIMFAPNTIIRGISLAVEDNDAVAYKQVKILSEVNDAKLLTLELKTGDVNKAVAKLVANDLAINDKINELGLKTGDLNGSVVKLVANDLVMNDKISELTNKLNTLLYYLFRSNNIPQIQNNDNKNGKKLVI